MKVQFYGDNCFTIESKDHAVVFNSNKNCSKSVDVAFVSSGGLDVEPVQNAKKTIYLPGEFEISGLLIRGFYGDDGKSVIYKIVFNEIAFVYFGNLENAPSKELLKKIGENMDMIFLSLDENFNGKKVRETIENLDPRVAFLGGDTQYFPKMIELGAKLENENHFEVNKSMINEEKVDMVMLGE